jgi:hypothetical protein
MADFRFRAAKGFRSMAAMKRASPSAAPAGPSIALVHGLAVWGAIATGVPATLVLGACESESTEQGAGGQTTVPVTGGAGAAAGAAAGAGGAQGGEAPGGGGAAPLPDTETEPNDGVADEDYDDIAASHPMGGTIEPAGDTDIFRLPTAPGTVLEARLTPEAGSALEPHLTLFDDGRGGEQEGSDYVKLTRTASGELRLQWLAMGEGGYYVGVRDARNVDGQSVGGAGFGYELEVTVVERATVTVGPLPGAEAHQDTLPFGGAVQLFDFEGTAWQDALIDLQAAGDLDGRLTVLAEATGDWIARNDDRSDTNVDPLIDAPLTEGGSLWLVVENVAESATSLGYELSASL